MAWSSLPALRRRVVVSATKVERSSRRFALFPPTSLSQIFCRSRGDRFGLIAEHVLQGAVRFAGFLADLFERLAVLIEIVEVPHDLCAPSPAPLEEPLTVRGAELRVGRRQQRIAVA